MGRAAQTSLKAGQDIARHGQDLARRAGDQATEFWRTSLTPMTQLQGEMNRWFEQIWRQASPARLQGGFPALLASPFAGFPVSDLHQTDEGLELLVELPGLKPENVQLSLRGDVLVLSGEKSATTEKGDGGYRVNERRFGRFERSFVLPPEADRNRIDAAFQDGLLRVSIPKLAEGEESKTIPVHA
jgi:HSP20 family protein